MVKIQECEVSRCLHKVTVNQREDDVVITNQKSGQFTTIPNELLPDLSGLLEYIAGYKN